MSAAAHDMCQMKLRLDPDPQPHPTGHQQRGRSIERLMLWGRIFSWWFALYFSLGPMPTVFWLIFYLPNLILSYFYYPGVCTKLNLCFFVFLFIFFYGRVGFLWDTNGKFNSCIHYKREKYFYSLLGCQIKKSENCHIWDKVFKRNFLSSYKKTEICCDILFVWFLSCRFIHQNCFFLLIHSLLKINSSGHFS